MTSQARPGPLDAETRAELAETVLPSLELTNRELAHTRFEPLAAPKVAGLPTVGIWRAYGPGWSAVLKVIRVATGGDERWRSTSEPTHPFYWRREALAFRDGLADLFDGGLRAPACYGVRDRADGSVAIWLEDLDGEPATNWPPERYARAARDLGYTQGRMSDSVSGELDQRWLSTGWLRAYLQRRQDDGHILAEQDAWAHPLVRAVLPARWAAEFRQLWAAREELLGVLDTAPRTLCHLDLNPRNLFAVGTQTAAIDWAFVGFGGLGEDLACMLVDPVTEFAIVPEQLHDHIRMVTAAYTAGLAAAGCEVDETQVRRIVAAGTAAKYGWVVPAVVSAAAAGRPTINGRPIAEAAPAWGSVGTFLLELAELALG